MNIRVLNMSIKVTPLIIPDDIDLMSIIVSWYLFSFLGLASQILMKTNINLCIPTDLRTCFTETLSTVRESSPLL